MANVIKDFFKKKKVEAKFKVAGGGHKLGDAASSSGAQAAAAAAARRQQPTPQRQHPTSSAQQAGAAALNRVAAAAPGTADRQGEDFQRARQKALIKEQARKELEKEKQMEAEIAKLTETYGDREPEVLEAPSGLEGIYFRCPLLGEEAVYPREEMKAKIREFLFSQLEQERGLTAVLIIHTCNSPRERVELCIETLAKYIDNILHNPTQEKFRKIRRSNKAFTDRVGSLEGTEDFLLGCGFQKRLLKTQDDAEEDFFVFPEEADIEHLSMMKETLMSAEPIRAELDRGLTILPPGSSSSSMGSLSNDFFAITAEEVKREQQGRADLVERESMLRTKAMREKEAGAGKRKYRYCLVRIRFPDGFLLQGTFAVHETLANVQEFVQDQLETPLPFLLLDSVTGQKLENMEASLQELGLVPASLLNFTWHPDIEADLAAAGGGNNLAFLKPDLRH